MPHEEVKERNIELALKTAYELFLTHGIENTTKEMLVRASNISRSSLDRYFADKADCVLKTAEWVGNNLHDKNAEVLGCIQNNNANKTGYELLVQYMDIVRNLLYDNPLIFVLGAECRMFIYRHFAEYNEGCGKLCRYLGSSEFLQMVFVKGINDGSLKSTIDAKKEAVILREAYISFLTSIAVANNHAILKDRTIIDSYARMLLDNYKNC